MDSRLKNRKVNLKVTQSFPSAGGNVEIIDSDLPTIRFQPHNEGLGGWSQVWWYFKIKGLEPGQTVLLELDRDIPRSSGISPQVFFSYDQINWGLTNTGMDTQINGRDFYIYTHKVKSDKVWFAYDLPYTPDTITKALIPKAKLDKRIEIFELCKTQQNREVTAFKFNSSNSDSTTKYGIWLQARAHAFESGSSWVLHELAMWLMSGNKEAEALRNCAEIFVVPIVDVDAVVEGRTGKYQKPHDHWMNWGEEPSYWVEVAAIKSLLNDWKNLNMVDLFIDFHGPGGLSHPFFILPFTEDLPYQNQRTNRVKFFEILESPIFNDEARKTQSMDRIHYSERPWNKTEISSSHEWVITKTTDHNIAMTLEVNMNTPLSTRAGYEVEAVTLGRAISKYFTESHHIR